MHLQKLSVEPKILVYIYVGQKKKNLPKLKQENISGRIPHTIL